MWPWEHVLVAYIAFSIVVRVAFGRPPSGTETAIVVFASLFPDLVDKPLGWQLGLFTSGYGIAHSIFVAIPLSIGVLLFTARRRRIRAGVAFGLGYLLHLPADVAPEALTDGDFPIERILWPMPSGESSHSHEVTDTPIVYFREYSEQLAAGEPVAYLLFCVLAVGVSLWIYDGMPGVKGPIARLSGTK